MSIHTNVVASNQELPVGVALRNLHGHLDFRGRFTEVFRREWNTGVDPVQWNVVSSATRVLRGVHVHRQHSDYFILLSGCASIGLRDLRRSSRSAGLAAVVELRSDVLQALTIPPGVAHGFYFHEPSIHLVLGSPGTSTRRTNSAVTGRTPPWRFPGSRPIPSCPNATRQLHR